MENNIDNFDLKPCPFCGGEAHVNGTLRPVSNQSAFYVFCENCMVTNAGAVPFHKSIKDASEHWNKRHVQAEQVEQTEQEPHYGYHKCMRCGEKTDVPVAFMFESKFCECDLCKSQG